MKADFISARYLNISAAEPQINGLYKKFRVFLLWNTGIETFRNSYAISMSFVLCLLLIKVDRPINLFTSRGKHTLDNSGRRIPVNFVYEIQQNFGGPLEVIWEGNMEVLWLTLVKTFKTLTIWVIGCWKTLKFLGVAGIVPIDPTKYVRAGFGLL